MRGGIAEEYLIGGCPTSDWRFSHRRLSHGWISYKRLPVRKLSRKRIFHRLLFHGGISHNKRLRSKHCPGRARARLIDRKPSCKVTSYGITFSIRSESTSLRCQAMSRGGLRYGIVYLQPHAEHIHHLRRSHGSPVIDCEVREMASSCIRTVTRVRLSLRSNILNLGKQVSLRA